MLNWAFQSRLCCCNGTLNHCVQDLSEFREQYLYTADRRQAEIRKIPLKELKHLNHLIHKPVHKPFSFPTMHYFQYRFLFYRAISTRVERKGRVSVVALFSQHGQRPPSKALC